MARFCRLHAVIACMVSYCYNAFLLTENISGMMTVIDRMSQTSALHTLQNWRQSHNRHGAEERVRAACNFSRGAYGTTRSPP